MSAVVWIETWITFNIYSSLNWPLFPIWSLQNESISLPEESEDLYHPLFNSLGQKDRTHCWLFWQSSNIDITGDWKVQVCHFAFWELHIYLLRRDISSITIWRCLRSNSTDRSLLYFYDYGILRLPMLSVLEICVQSNIRSGESLCEPSLVYKRWLCWFRVVTPYLRLWDVFSKDKTNKPLPNYLGKMAFLGQVDAEYGGVQVFGVHVHSSQCLWNDEFLGPLKYQIIIVMEVEHDPLERGQFRGRLVGSLWGCLPSRQPVRCNSCWRRWL